MMFFFRIIMSLVLIAIFFTGSLELRIVTATLSSWALGLVLLRRLSLSPTFLRRHHLFIFVSGVLLAATNTLFYESTAGRCLDLFFPRSSYDPDTPGSGFTDIYDTFARRHRVRLPPLRSRRHPLVRKAARAATQPHGHHRIPRPHR
jgi:hypothetical protein